MLFFINFFLNKFRLLRFRFKFRKKNKHNFTVPTSVFPLNLVSVGKNSYGPISVESYKNPKESLVIGNYVSIANKVVFILGGNHRIDSLSTFPFYSKLIKLNPEIDSLTKGPIIVEDDVWIGYGAIILSGVCLKKGCVVAAGSVVTKDVPSYAVVGGNPAKIIKFRFDKEIIEELFCFNISDIKESEIIHNINSIYQTLTIESLNDIKALIENK